MPEERKFFMVCAMPGCEAELECPDGAEPWGWISSDQVKAFKAEHVAHGNDRTVGPVIRYIEKD